MSDLKKDPSCNVVDFPNDLSKTIESFEDFENKVRYEYLKLCIDILPVIKKIAIDKKEGAENRLKACAAILYTGMEEWPKTEEDVSRKTFLLQSLFSGPCLPICDS